MYHKKKKTTTDQIIQKQGQIDHRSSAMAKRSVGNDTYLMVAELLKI